MRNNAALFVRLLYSFCAVSLFLSGCGSAPTATQVSPSPAPAETLQPTAIPLPTASPTPAPLPQLTLNPGDLYFSLNGKPTFLFSRNVAGYTPADFNMLADWAHQQGDLVVRVGLDNGVMGGINGYGYSSDGIIQRDWDRNWENFITHAETDDLYVIPYFTGWMDWNDTGYSTWLHNPLNSVNGGPAKDPRDIYKRNSPTQLLYIQWFKNVVTRWQSHKNILAWEVVSEVNLIDGIDQADGIYLVEQLAKAAREADPLHRPVTASLADTGNWSDFFRSDAVEFINLHPYPASAMLDTTVLSEVRQLVRTYNKPVLIGESGLSALTPDTSGGAITISPNARTGVQHAIWAELVSGAMNGRALWWEDGFAFYFKNLGQSFLQGYDDVEAPIFKFIDGVDMTDFKPIAAQYSGDLVGATLGNSSLIIGWFRDASCEPPNWNTQSVVSKSSVVLTLPGSSGQWKVEFYDPKTGTDIISSVTLSQTAGTLTIPLPDFKDDIAFKMYIQK
jgi:hypothetical protein